MLKRLAWMVGTRLIDWSEGHIDVVARARELEQRHTEMVIHDRGRGMIEVTCCGRSVTVVTPKALDDHDPKRPYSDWWHYPCRRPEDSDRGN